MNQQRHVSPVQYCAARVAHAKRCFLDVDALFLCATTLRFLSFREVASQIHNNPSLALLPASSPATKQLRFDCLMGQLEPKALKSGHRHLVPAALLYAGARIPPTFFPSIIHPRFSWGPSRINSRNCLRSTCTLEASPPPPKASLPRLQGGR